MVGMPRALLFHTGSLDPCFQKPDASLGQLSVKRYWDPSSSFALEGTSLALRAKLTNRELDGASKVCVMKSPRPGIGAVA